MQAPFRGVPPTFTFDNDDKERGTRSDHKDAKLSDKEVTSGENGGENVATEDEDGTSEKSGEVGWEPKIGEVKTEVVELGEEPETNDGVVSTLEFVSADL